jgi:hypothetical protein
MWIPNSGFFLALTLDVSITLTFDVSRHTKIKTTCLIRSLVSLVAILAIDLHQLTVTVTMMMMLKPRVFLLALMAGVAQSSAFAPSTRTSVMTNPQSLTSAQRSYATK